MLSMLGLFVIALIVVGALGNGPFTGHTVIRITPHNEDEVARLQQLLAQLPDLDVWRSPSCVECHVDVRLTPAQFDDVTAVLKQQGFTADMVVPNVQSLLDSQRKKVDLRATQQTAGFDYSRYHSIAEIHSWVNNITKAYADITEMFSIGRSYEGRDLLALKISTSKWVTKPAFWIEGGIHAREWISPATVIYMVGQMLDNYKKDPELTAMVDMFDWYILPVTNPDGYAYTWISDETRMWRKTRSPQDEGCDGADPNRNWDHAWGVIGSSHYPCSETYHGPMPFSEPEIEAVSRKVQTIKNLKAFIDFHSYGQYILTPWGNHAGLPKDFAQQRQSAALAAEAIGKVHGTKYRFGNHAKTLYTASGISIDWAYGVMDVTYSYVIELRDDGKYNFILPEDQILATGEETLEGLKALAKYVYEN